MRWNNVNFKYKNRQGGFHGYVHTLKCFKEVCHANIRHKLKSSENRWMYFIKKCRSRNVFLQTSGQLNRFQIYRIK